MKRVALVSIHTSPLARPGSGDAGGMNVYIDQLARTLAQRDVAVEVFTRSVSAEPDVVDVVPGYRVVHVHAGPERRVPLQELASQVRVFTDGILRWAEEAGVHYDVVHSHYWMSGWVGLLMKRELGIAMAHSFHTLGRVKELSRRAGEPLEALVRIATEHQVIDASDCVIASTPAESSDLLTHYGAEPARLCVNPPGVDHGAFAPGPRRPARQELGLPDAPLVLFAGRIQPLKGADVAVEALAILRAAVPDARLAIVGGPSGSSGPAESARLDARIEQLGLQGNVHRFPSQPHVRLPAFYRAADVVVVPSRSESFGLVAVEAQACGRPVVAARVGGLAHVVADGESGYLIDGWDPGDYAAAITGVLTDAEHAARLGKGAFEFARQFSWQAAADRMLELYSGISGR